VGQLGCNELKLNGTLKGVPPFRPSGTQEDPCTKSSFLVCMNSPALINIHTLGYCPDAGDVRTTAAGDPEGQDARAGYFPSSSSARSRAAFASGAAELASAYFR
jgi:hypothetical protein